MNRDYIELLQESTKKFIGVKEYRNKKLVELYEDLKEDLSNEELTKLDNLFTIVCGISLDTVINSEDAESIVQEGLVELIKLF